MLVTVPFHTFWPECFSLSVSCPWRATEKVQQTPFRTVHDFGIVCSSHAVQKMLWTSFLVKDYSLPSLDYVVVSLFPCINKKAFDASYLYEFTFSSGAFGEGKLWQEEKLFYCIFSLRLSTFFMSGGGKAHEKLFLLQSWAYLNIHSHAYSCFAAFTRVTLLTEAKVSVKFFLSPSIHCIFPFCYRSAASCKFFIVQLFTTNEKNFLFAKRVRSRSIATHVNNQ